MPFIKKIFEKVREVIMGIFGKKLKLKKNNGTVESITLYTTKAEAGEERLALKVDGTIVYAAVGDDSNANASSLKVGEDKSVLMKKDTLLTSSDFALSFDANFFSSYLINQSKVIIIPGYHDNSTYVKYFVICIPKKYLNSIPRKINIKFPKLGIDETIPYETTANNISCSSIYYDNNLKDEISWDYVGPDNYGESFYHVSAGEEYLIYESPTPMNDKYPYKPFLGSHNKPMEVVLTPIY